MLSSSGLPLAQNSQGSTRMARREQYSSSPQWYSQLDTRQWMLVLGFFWDMIHSPFVYLRMAQAYLAR